MDRSGGALLIFAGVWGVSRERRINSGHESIDLPFYRKNLPNSPPLFFSFVIDDDDEESNDRFLSDVQKEKGFSLPFSFAPEKRVVDSRRLFSISPSLVEGKGWRPRSCHACFKCINNERPVSGTRDTIGSGARRIFSSRTRATACTETVN